MSLLIKYSYAEFVSRYHNNYTVLKFSGSLHDIQIETSSLDELGQYYHFRPSELITYLLENNPDKSLTEAIVMSGRGLRIAKELEQLLQFER